MMERKSLIKILRSPTMTLGLVSALVLISCRGKAFISVPEADAQGDNADLEGQKQGAEAEEEIPAEPSDNDDATDTGDETKPVDMMPMKDMPVPEEPQTPEPPKEDPKPDPDPVPEVPMPPPQTFADGDYIIKGVGSGRCMNVPSSSPTVGTTIDIYDCDKRDAQIWKFQHVGDNHFRLVNRWGKAMEVYQGIMNVGTAVLTMEVSNKTYQTYRFDKQADGSYIITVKGSDMRLNVVGSGTANGTQIQIYTSNNNASQKWQVLKP